MWGSCWFLDWCSWPFPSPSPSSYFLLPWWGWAWHQLLSSRHCRHPALPFPPCRSVQACTACHNTSKDPPGELHWSRCPGSQVHLGIGGTRGSGLCCQHLCFPWSFCGLLILASCKVLQSLLEVLNEDDCLLGIGKLVWYDLFVEYLSEDIVIESSVVGVDEHHLVVLSQSHVFIKYSVIVVDWLATLFQFFQLGSHHKT